MKKIGIVTILSLASFFSGCLEYKKAICTDEKLVDVPELIGNHKMHFIDRDFNSTHLSYELERVDRGIYKATGTDRSFRTCKAPYGQILAETKLPNGNIAGYFIYIDSSGSKAQSYAIADLQSLDEAGIPYVVEERSTEQMMSFTRNSLEKELLQTLSSNEKKEKVLVIDNSKPESKFEELLTPLAIGLVSY